MRNRSLIYALLIICLFFASKWIFQGAYFEKDLIINTIPLENLYGQIQRSGESPLWAPELAGGYPLLASGQLGFWYPPHMLLRQFLPGVWTLNISLLLHAILAAVGTFFFLKHNKLSNLASCAAAVMLPLSAAFVGKYSSLNLILPFMWAPLLFLLLQLFMERGKSYLLTIWIGATALCVLVGHPQMALYVLFSEILFMCCLMAFSWDRWRRALVMLFGFSVVLGITSFYVVPIAANISNTDRATGTLQQNPNGTFNYQFSPIAFLGVIIPHPFGHAEAYRGPTNESELSSYVGPIGLLLAIIGLFANRRKFPVVFWFSLLLIVVGLLLAIGSYSPLFMWLFTHGWNYFNAPSRFFLYANMGIIFLMAIGIDMLRPFLRPYLIIAAVFPVLWVSWSWHQGVPWKFTAQPASAQILRNEQGFVRIFSGGTIAENSPDNDFGIKDWNPICKTCVYRQTFVSLMDHIDGIALKFSNVQAKDGILTLKLYTATGEKIREVTFSNRLLLDSDWNTFSFQSIQHTSNKDFYIEITSNMERQDSPKLLIHTNPVQQYDPSGRLYNCVKGTCSAVKNDDAAFALIADSKAVPYYDALAPYVSAGFGIGTMQWSGSLPIGIVKTYLGPLGTWGDPWGNGARTIINRFAATHFIGLFSPYRYADSLDGVSLIASVPEGDTFLRLYRNEEAFSRLAFAQNIKAVSDPIDQINTVKKLLSTDYATVVANVQSDLTFSAVGNTAQITNESRTSMRIQTHQTSDGFLVLRDILLDGWSARIDNNTVPIYRVDGIFRGIMVPAGNHIVVFQYRPSWIKPVLWIEGVSLIIFIMLVAGAYERVSRRITT